MEPHRPRQNDAQRAPRKRSARALPPLDAGWLEKEAIRSLARGERSKKSLRDLLDRKLRTRCERSGEDPEEVAELIPSVVAGLAKQGYVNDRRYAEQLIAHMRRQGRPAAQIDAKLETQGVDPAIRAALERELFTTAREDSPKIEFDLDLEAAWRLARKRGLGPYCTDAAERARKRTKHLGVLARQGFSEEIAYQVINAEETPEEATAKSADAADPFQ